MGHPTQERTNPGSAPDFARSGKRTAPEPANGNVAAGVSIETAKKRLNPLKRKQLEDRVHELEEQISRTEAAITRLETALQNFVSAEESQRQAQELDQHKASHATLIEEWESLSESLQTSD